MAYLTATEEHEHRALAHWIALMQYHYPDLRMAFHPANGGKRPKAAAGKMKALGQQAGVPDVIVLVPKGQFHGLAIELKVQGGRATKEQLNWIAALREHGYCAEICMGWEKARDMIVDYLTREGRVVR